MDITLEMIEWALVIIGAFIWAVGFLWYFVGYLLAAFHLNLRRGIGAMVMFGGLLMVLGGFGLMAWIK